VRFRLAHKSQVGDRLYEGQCGFDLNEVYHTARSL
jgi:hypothetical protein